jgi:hypothetical protein
VIQIMLLLFGMVIPVVLIGTDVDVDTFIFPFIIETTDGCLINDDDIGVSRHVVGVVTDEDMADDDDNNDDDDDDDDDDEDDEDDEPVTDALMI